MSDYYNGINKEEDRQTKLMDKVYEWWNSLTKQKRFDVMLDWYPMEVHKDTNIDKMFGDMANTSQIELWLDNNPDEILTKEEKEQIRYDKGW